MARLRGLYLRLVSNYRDDAQVHLIYIKNWQRLGAADFLQLIVRYNALLCESVNDRRDHVEMVDYFFRACFAPIFNSFVCK